ncbi:MAG: hypothetical protein KGI50_00515 [Patescibacteria group bacterium]|nr:hypothetical protein [Patescibacteria group bacterium]MDE2438161.1 hypothetical protein [Patescibacteria group bacterium]
MRDFIKPREQEELKEVLDNLTKESEALYDALIQKEGEVENKEQAK